MKNANKLTKLIKYDRLYMDIAIRVAEMSHAVRLKVGSLLVKEGRIISMGWNGMPSGFDNCCEDIVGYFEQDPTKPILQTRAEVLHAEANVLTKLARSTESGEDSTIYITHSPCIECAKLILQTKIKRVVVNERYRDSAGLDLLTGHVEWEIL